MNWSESDFYNPLDDLKSYNINEVLELIDFCVKGGSNQTIFLLSQTVLFNEFYALQLEGEIFLSTLPKYTRVSIKAEVNTDDCSYTMCLGSEHERGMIIDGKHLTRDEIKNKIILPFLEVLSKYISGNYRFPFEIDHNYYGKRVKKDSPLDFVEFLERVYYQESSLYEQYSDRWQLKFTGIKQDPRKRTGFDIIIDGCFHQEFKDVSPDEIICRQGELYIQGLRCPVLDSKYIESLSELMIHRSETIRGTLIIFMKKDGSIEYACNGHKRGRFDSFLYNQIYLAGHLDDFHLLRCR